MIRGPCVSAAEATQMFARKRETFRKAALEQLASPERLDEMMVVTSPKGWVALGACGLLLVLVAVWSVTGMIPERVLAEGILIPGGAVTPVQSGASGRIIEFLVKVQDEVEAGQELARISVKDQDLDLEILNEEWERLSAENERMTLQEEARHASEKAALDKSRRSQEDVVRAAETAHRESQVVLETKRRGVEQGFASQAQVRQAETDLQLKYATWQSELSKFADFDARAARLETEILLEQGRRKEEMNRKMDQIRRTSETRERSMVVRAPSSGRVYEVSVAENSEVGVRDVVMRLERTDADLLALLYVPSKPGKKIESGQRVYLSPSSVKREEFGSIHGTVVETGDQPASRGSMVSELGNEDLVQEFLGSGTVFRVRAFLEKDGETRSGYRWTSGKGPEAQIISGTRCAATIVVGEKRPIDFVIPYFKEFFLG